MPAFADYVADDGCGGDGAELAGQDAMTRALVPEHEHNHASAWHGVTDWKLLLMGPGSAVRACFDEAGP